MNHDVILLTMLQVRMLLMVRQACKCLICCQFVHFQKHSLHQITLCPIILQPLEVSFVWPFFEISIPD